MWKERGRKGYIHTHTYMYTPHMNDSIPRYILSHFVYTTLTFILLGRYYFPKFYRRQGEQTLGSEIPNLTAQGK